MTQYGSQRSQLNEGSAKHLSFILLLRSINYKHTDWHSNTNKSTDNKRYT